MDRTLIICKPDAVERGLTGEIIRRIEAKGLKLVAAELKMADKATAEEHYAEHKDKPFYGELVTFITRSPAMFMVVEGPSDTWKVMRLMIGATNPQEAEPGSIRGDLAVNRTENLVHGSDSQESADREIKLWFPSL